MLNLQALMDGISAQWQRERAATQLTLGKLISNLEAMPATAHVANLHSLRSYRGYYADLAFELGTGDRPAADLLAECKSAIGKAFEGYKGGKFTMGEMTPLWISEYRRSSGTRLMDVLAGGGIETAQEEDKC